MKRSLIIAGIVSSAIGCDIWISKGGIIYQQQVPQYAGIVLIVFGVLSFGVGLFTHRKINVKYICYRCEKIVNHSADEKKVCDNCRTQLEPLKGFYDRHPEKK
jgi:sulfite exporter TauE/SafE